MSDEIGSFIYGLISDPAFWIGGFVIPLIGLIVLWFVGRIMAAWNNIVQFFQPIQTPGQLPTEQGPSPFASLVGCLLATVGLLCIIGIIFILVSLAIVR